MITSTRSKTRELRRKIEDSGIPAVDVDATSRYGDGDDREL